jgi:hypothetical protein
MGVGASVIASQSRQENFSRTRSMIFQRRGSHSRVFDITSPGLCSPALPHLPPRARRQFNDPFDRQVNEEADNDANPELLQNSYLRATTCRSRTQGLQRNFNRYRIIS